MLYINPTMCSKTTVLTKPIMFKGPVMQKNIDVSFLGPSFEHASTLFIYNPFLPRHVNKDDNVKKGIVKETCQTSVECEGAARDKATSIILEGMFC